MTSIIVVFVVLLLIDCFWFDVDAIMIPYSCYCYLNVIVVFIVAFFVLLLLLFLFPVFIVCCCCVVMLVCC